MGTGYNHIGYINPHSEFIPFQRERMGDERLLRTEDVHNSNLGGPFSIFTRIPGKMIQFDQKTGENKITTGIQKRPCRQTSKLRQAT